MRENSCQRIVPHAALMATITSLDNITVNLQFSPETILKPNTTCQTQRIFHERNYYITFSVTKDNSIIEIGQVMNTSTVIFQFSVKKKFSKKLGTASCSIFLWKSVYKHQYLQCFLPTIDVLATLGNPNNCKTHVARFTMPLHKHSITVHHIKQLKTTTLMV
jgi:putative alpha-1,2-mannosidase